MIMTLFVANIKKHWMLLLMRCLLELWKQWAFLICLRILAVTWRAGFMGC